MKIIDLNGHQIEITDLDEAIRKAAEFKTYRHIDKRHSQMDKQLKAYWTDIYEKLTAIKKRLTTL